MGREIVPARVAMAQRARQGAVRQGEWKYRRDEDGEYLFDLVLDPGERKDRKGGRTSQVSAPHVDGRIGYGVVVKWYRDGAETRYEPMEVFPLAPVGDAEPGEWSPWFRAATLRPGAFGWWAEVHGTPVDSIPKPDLPFELRWRTMLTDVAGLVP